jgi:hypothetical protein
MRTIGILVWTLLLVGCQLAEKPLYPRHAATESTLSVLFIGNSLTYYNDLPGLVADMSSGQPRPMAIETETAALRTLAKHVSIGRAQAKLASRRWDVVVLQEYSREPVTNPLRSREAFAKLASIARAQGARVIVFENWPRAWRSQEAASLQQELAATARAVDGRLAPIGTVWMRVRDQHPQIRLLQDDRHPTPAGTYLAACVLFRTIYDAASPEPVDPTQKIIWRSAIGS